MMTNITNKTEGQTYYVARHVAGSIYRLVVLLGQAEAGLPSERRLVDQRSRRCTIVTADAEIAPDCAVGRYVRVDGGAIVEVP